MKPRLLHILAAAGLALAAASCEEINIDDRYIEMDAVTPQRAVLLEEFTGQECTNCPEGHKIVASLREQYGAAVIPVSIHASRLSYSEADFPGFGLGIAEGETYYKNAGSPNLPSGVVDRRGGAIGRDQWSESVRNALEKPTPVQLEVQASYSDEGIFIDTNMLSSEDISCSLQIWLVESGLQRYQLDNGVVTENYVHNHVLRAVVNGVNGENVSLTKNVYSYNQASYKAHDDWKPENMAAVVFVYDGSGVLQAAEAEVQIMPEYPE